MVIPRQDLPEDLMFLMSQVSEGTTLLEIVSAFLISVLKRHNGNRTWTSRELKIPVRTLRNRIWQLESMGYDVPLPKVHEGGYAAFKKSKTRKKFSKKSKLYDL